MSGYFARGGGGGPPGGGGGGGEAAGEEAAAARQPAYAKGPQGKFVQHVVERINGWRRFKKGRRTAGVPMTFDGQGPCPFPSLLAQPPDAFLEYQVRDRHGFLEPDHLYYRPVYIWAPELYFRADLPDGLPCPNCNEKGWHLNKGWIDEAVPLYDIDSTHSLMSRRYECTRCKVKFTGHSPEVVQSLPRHVQESADFNKVGRSYVTTRLVRVVRDYMADSGNIAGAHRLILSGHKSVYHRTEMRYYAFNRRVAESNVGLGLGAPTRFSSYEDPEGWAGASFTRNVINNAYLMDSALRQPFLTRHMQMLPPGRVICVDDSFKATKLIRSDGAKPFDCLFGLMGEGRRILSYQFSEDQSHRALEQVTQGLQNRIVQHAFDPPEVLYTDKCCADSFFYQKQIPSLASGGGGGGLRTPRRILTLPPRPDGTPGYLLLNTAVAIDEQCGRIMELEGLTYFSVDMEWAIPAEGPGPVALIQVTVPGEFPTYLFHLSGLCGARLIRMEGKFPRGLRALLESEGVTKVGVNIECDKKKLFKDYGVEITHTVDLAHFAYDKGLLPNRRASLRTLCWAFLKADLPKDQNTRMSDWTGGRQHTLTTEQKEYAALDALAGLQLYEVLRSKRSVLEYETVTVDTAEEGMRVVLLAGGNREEVGRGTIIKPPFRGRQVWEPAYGMALGKEEKVDWITRRLTSSRLVVAVLVVKAPCAMLPFSVDPAVSTIAHAAAQCDKEGGNQVLWEVSRVRLLPQRKRGGERGEGGGGEGGGEEVEGNDDDHVSVSSRAATPADEDEFDDTWEDGLESDRQCAQALWDGVPETEEGVKGGVEGGQGKALEFLNCFSPSNGGKPHLSVTILTHTHSHSHKHTHTHTHTNHMHRWWCRRCPQWWRRRRRRSWW